MNYPEPPAARIARLPDVTAPGTSGFWEALRRHELVAQRCATCGALRYPATDICPTCWSSDQAWVPIAETAELYSYVIYHRALDPAMKDEVPYVVGRVVTDDGVIFTVRLDVDPDDVRIGMRLRASWDDVTDEVTLLRFASDTPNPL